MELEEQLNIIINGATKLNVEHIVALKRYVSLGNSIVVSTNYIKSSKLHCECSGSYVIHILVTMSTHAQQGLQY